MKLRGMDCFAIAVLGAIFWFPTGAYALAGAIGDVPKPLQDKDFKVRATYWMREMRLAANPGRYQECRKNLISLGPKAVPTITEAVEKDDGNFPWLHWNTALVLGKIGDDRALPYLLKRIKPVSRKDLKSRPEWTYVRAFAALALGKIKDPAQSAHAPLRKIVTEPKESKFLKRAAILALGTLRDKDGVALIGKILLDPRAPSTMRGAAAISLGMIPGEATVELFTKYLASKLVDHDGLTDRMVVQAMGYLNADGTAPLLRTQLASLDESLRGTTALVLAYLNDRGSASLVKNVMEDRYAPGFTRCNSALALADLGAREEGGQFLRTVLQAAITDPKAYSTGTLAYAAVAMGRFRNDETLKLLRLILLKKTVSPVVKMNAVNALGHLKDPRMIPVLLERLHNLKGTNHQYIRGEIIRALLNHDPEEAIRKALLKAMKDNSVYVRQKATVALSRYPGPDTERALFVLLGDRVYDLRAEAALTLGVLKSFKAIPTLRKMLLKDKSDWVRLCCRKALENIIKYGNHPTWQTSGLQRMISQRTRVVGASMKEEMDRLYTVAYQRVLELDKQYRANKRVW